VNTSVTRNEVELRGIGPDELVVPKTSVVVSPPLAPLLRVFTHVTRESPPLSWSPVLACMIVQMPPSDSGSDPVAVGSKVTVYCNVKLDEKPFESLRLKISASVGTMGALMVTVTSTGSIVPDKTVIPEYIRSFCSHPPWLCRVPNKIGATVQGIGAALATNGSNKTPTNSSLFMFPPNLLRKELPKGRGKIQPSRSAWRSVQFPYYQLGL
jgi:hypothetical protein